MDIWHTCEPDKVGTEGWLGRAIRDIDPHKDNVLTGVNWSRPPRALAAPGVPVASVGNLETYGVLTGIEGADQRSQALDLFAMMYSSKLGSSLVREYISQTGTDALSGADTGSTAPQKYTSTVKYASDTVSQYMRNIAQVHLAGLGTKILHTTAPEQLRHPRHRDGETPSLWQDVSNAVSAFYQDLKEHNASANVVVFCSRSLAGGHDNGSGTDHGSGGIAFVIGDAVKGSHSTSWAPEKLLEGDLHYNNDFRSTYATPLEQWMVWTPNLSLAAALSSMLSCRNPGR